MIEVELPPLDSVLINLIIRHAKALHEDSIANQQYHITLLDSLIKVAQDGLGVKK